MSLTEYRHGALAVVQNVQDHFWINRLLQSLDRNLFVEKQLTLDHEEVWCVVESVGSDRVPVTVYQWRDGLGRPIPYLTEGIVDEMRRRAREGRTRADAARIADEHNRRLKELRREESRDDYEDAAKDFFKTARKGSNASVPRSAGLAASRRRIRRRQEDAQRAAHEAGR